MKTLTIYLTIIFATFVFLGATTPATQPCDSICKVKVDSMKQAYTDSIAMIKKSEAAKYAKELGLGNVNPWVYFWGSIYGFAGVLFVFLALAYQGIKRSPDTPDTFSKKEFWSNVNMQRRGISIALTTMVILLTMRFPIEFGVSETVTMFGCFIAKILSFRKVVPTNTNPVQ
jgi:hypothetical protein